MIDTRLPPITCSGLNTTNNRRCTAPARRLALVGCIHEHTIPIYLCAGHDELGVDGETTCRTCSLAGHRCPLNEIRAGVDDVDQLLADHLTVTIGGDGLDREETQAFVLAHLHQIIPPHLRTLAPTGPQEEQKP